MTHLLPCLQKAPQLEKLGIETKPVLSGSRITGSAAGGYGVRKGEVAIGIAADFAHAKDAPPLIAKAIYSQ
ncbi:hypothetical protein PGTUg99_012895 [Puccinia graminis f. sp. tritici]|uniref:Uncharacterized protein n=1 Tax=Puccinia graminis f. sp. tritici TaxID=56615 RepID=A0A5B0M9G5_PUCGR|nr:hypothetical protein PGTUg99_012895 [Puccinia graminis f. sp. tritici]